MNFIKKLVLVLVVLVSFWLIYTSSFEEKEIPNRIQKKVGIVLPLSGNLAFIGKTIQNGIELSKLDNNISETDLKLLYSDSKGNVKDGLKAVQKLLNVDKVDYIIVNLTSVAMASKSSIVSKKNNTIGFMLSTHPNVIENSSNLIRTFINGKQEAQLLINYVKERKIKDIAVIYVDDAYGSGMAEYIQTQLKVDTNIEINGYKLSNFNFEPILQKLKAKNFENVVLIGYGFEYSKFFQVLKSLNYSPLIMSNLSFSNKKGQEIDSYDNKIVFDMPIFDNVEKRSLFISNFIKNYQSKFGTIPDFNAAYGYDTMLIIKYLRDSKLHINREQNITIDGVTGKLTILKTGESITELELVEK
jgi:branched-chain amino acid transport system substrate-binding protein